MAKQKRRNLKLIEGSAKKNIPDIPEAQSIKRMWPAPAHIGKHGKKLWHGIGPQLIGLGILNQLNRRGFEGLCFLHDQIRELQDLIRQDGLTIQGSRGTQKKNPAASLLIQYQNSFNRVSDDFCLTEISRRRAGIKLPKQDVEKLDKFLKSKKFVL